MSNQFRTHIIIRGERVLELANDIFNIPLYFSTFYNFEDGKDVVNCRLLQPVMVEIDEDGSAKINYYFLSEPNPPLNWALKISNEYPDVVIDYYSLKEEALHQNGVIEMFVIQNGDFIYTDKIDD